mmetsp:Transcript_1696/g.5955  ORF Transcript_1696/g.5955 Transcript_1696/m.5955 type:complete len:1360 (-) Transcript_1696:1167-5246(-)
MAKGPDAEEVLAQLAAWQPRSNFHSWRRLCPPPEASVADVFLRVVRGCPDEVALENFALNLQAPQAAEDSCRVTPFTFRELAARVGTLAAAMLEARGASTEGGPLVLWVDEGEPLVTAMLAAAVCGLPFVPVDIRQPVPRCASLVCLCGAPLALCTASQLPQVERVCGWLSSTDQCEKSVRNLVFEELVEPRNQESVDARVAQLMRRVEDNVSRGLLSGKTLLYMIFTSGSTGEPKAVRCSHGQALSYAAAKAKDEQIGGVGGVVPFFAEGGCSDRSASHRGGGRVLLVSAHTFDLCQGDCLSAILSGATFIVFSPNARVALRQRLREAIQVSRCSHIHLTPSLFSLVDPLSLPPARAFPALRCISLAGELIPDGFVQHWGRREVSTGHGDEAKLVHRVELRNVYGCTEATVVQTSHVLKATDEPSCVGVPLGNSFALVVESATLALVPAGVEGEIAIGGGGLPEDGQGYHRAPDLNARRFVVHPVMGTLFLTGDRGFWDPKDNLLHVRGRIEFEQVKLNGLRLELGEVEAALRSCTLVRVGAAVLIRTEGWGPRPSSGASTHQRDVLCGVVVLHEGEGHPDETAAYMAEPGLERLDQLTQRAIDFVVRQKLPQGLCPTQYWKMPALPLTTSGKLDRKVLSGLLTAKAECAPSGRACSRAAEPAVACSVPAKQDGAGLRNEMEVLVASAWSKALGLPWPIPTSGHAGVGGGLALTSRSHFFQLGGDSVAAIRVAAYVAVRLLPAATTAQNLGAKADAGCRSMVWQEEAAREILMRPVLADFAMFLETECGLHVRSPSFSPSEPGASVGEVGVVAFPGPQSTLERLLTEAVASCRVEVVAACLATASEYVDETRLANAEPGRPCNLADRPAPCPPETPGRHLRTFLTSLLLQMASNVQEDLNSALVRWMARSADTENATKGCTADTTGVYPHSDCVLAALCQRDGIERLTEAHAGTACSQLATLLVAHGANLEGSNVFDELCQRPLHMAVRRLNLGFMVALLGLGADPGGWDGNKQTMLHLAVRSHGQAQRRTSTSAGTGGDAELGEEMQSGRLQVAHYILLCAAAISKSLTTRAGGVNCKDRWGRTAADWALLNGDVAAIRVLHQVGARLNEAMLGVIGVGIQCCVASSRCGPGLQMLPSVPDVSRKGRQALQAHTVERLCSQLRDLLTAPRAGNGDDKELPNVLSALRNLVCDVHLHREAAREAGLIGTLVGLVRARKAVISQDVAQEDGDRSLDITIHAIGCLRNLCYSNKRNRASLAEEGAIELLAELMALPNSCTQRLGTCTRASGGLTEMSFRCASALCALAASPELRDSIVQAGAVPGISALLGSASGVHSGALRSLLEEQTRANAISQGAGP